MQQHSDAGAGPLAPLSAAQVELRDAFLCNAERQAVRFLLSLEPERFLSSWRATSGLAPVRPAYEDSWERTRGINFRGHMFGHYLSALAQAYDGARDAALRAQLRERICAGVNGIAACQEAYAARFPARAGYAAPFTEAWLNDKDGVDAGSEPWNAREEGSETYVPWYNLHKVLAGLLAVHRALAGDEIGRTALAVACRFADYLYRCRVSHYTPQQKTKLLATEYGGMPEALYELYALTGRPQDKACADAFVETALLRELAAGHDVLAGLHANTTIPKVTGMLKKYTVLTQNAAYYAALTPEERAELPLCRRAAENFFAIVTAGHSYVTGGNSVNEHFRAANTIASFYQDAETHETCNEYNMLKLARALFCLTGEKKYADYYENTYFNAILPSQDPATGAMTYFQPMGAGYSKIYCKSRFWCCTGTGVESFTKLGDSLYFQKDGCVFVNLYFSSVLHCPERGLTLTVDAALPARETVTLTVRGEIAPGTSLRLRVPAWCAGAPQLQRNGAPLACEARDGCLAVEQLADGDVFTLTLPMAVSVSALRDDGDVVAFRYGPAVLAGALHGLDARKAEDAGILVLRAVRDPALPTAIPLASASAEEWKQNIRALLVRVEDTPEGVVQFRLQGTRFAEPLVFVPYYAIHSCRYGLYWRLEPDAEPRP